MEFIISNSGVRDKVTVLSQNMSLHPKILLKNLISLKIFMQEMSFAL